MVLPIARQDRRWPESDFRTEKSGRGWGRDLPRGRRLVFFGSPPTPGARASSRRAATSFTHHHLMVDDQFEEATAALRDSRRTQGFGFDEI